MAELGFTGLNESGGVVREDFLREWQGKEAYKRANEMRLNSPVVGALLSAIDLSVRKVEWSLSSETDSDPRVELWELTLDHLQGGFDNFISEALTFLPFGFALFETVWTRYENQVILGKLAPRGQDTVYRWLIKPNGDCEGFVQVAAPSYQQVTLPIDKLLHITARSEKNNPEGRSILRTAWLPYYYAKNIMQIEAIGVERDLAGMPVVGMPQNANTKEDDPNSDAIKAAKMVRNVRRDEAEGIVRPYGWEFELLSTGGSRQFDTDKIINRYEQRILMSSLAQFLVLGSASTGAYALSKDQTDLFNMAVNSIADIITDALNDQILPRLMRLNGYDTEGLTLTHSTAGDVDIETMAGALSQLVSAGLLTPLPKDEVFVRSSVGFPEVTEEELIEAQEEKQERALEAMQRTTNPQAETRTPANPTRQNTEDDTDEADAEDEGDETRMGIDIFASTAPDAKKRMAYEREMQRNVQKWLNGVMTRVKRSVKRATI